MIKDTRIAESLVATNAFRDLEEPVIITSGQLAIYYVTTQNLLEDGGAWEKHADVGVDLADHAQKIYEADGRFKEVIDIVTERVSERLSFLLGPSPDAAISGGQRRDWIFSGPVAYLLGLPHVMLYKDGTRADISDLRADIPFVQAVNLSDYGRVVHVADLLTEGSSAYLDTGTIPRGWIPMIRQRQGTIEDLFTIVTRRQGGEERLADQGVKTHSFVAIDADFLRTYSVNPERTLLYLSDPTRWSKDYLSTNGALELVKAFDPAAKDERGFKFLKRYETTLREAGKWEELEKAVRQRYGVDLKSAFGCGVGN